MFRFLLLTMAFIFPACALAQTLTPEIPDRRMQDIAMVFPNRDSPTGAVIIYNPDVCWQIGAACIFFKFHEHGHVQQGHHLRPQVHPSQRTAQENEADLYAARFAPANAVATAWWLFQNGLSSSDWHTYGTPQQRAYRLCVYAKQYNNWTGPFNAC